MVSVLQVRKLNTICAIKFHKYSGKKNFAENLSQDVS